VGDRITAGGRELALNYGYLPSERCGVLLAVAYRYWRQARAAYVLKVLGIRRPEVQQWKPVLDQLRDHFLRDLPTG
jgi:hypothetical protein